MNMHISGSGKIPQGEYGKISVSGSGRLYGAVHCSAFSSSGSTRGESIVCAEGFKASGSTSFTGDIRAKDFRVSGSFSCGGRLQADESFSCSGSAKCEKDLTARQVSVFGALTVGGNIEAESLRAAGAVNCSGCLRADSIEITAEKALTIGKIESRSIHVRRKRFSIMLKRGITVPGTIVGEDIALEYVTCPSVTGRVVKVGKGCHIDLVRYSEAVEIAPGATVGKTEKL